ncbi:hypothetical protein QFW77_10040 [Luteimonas sp. RD2P54]|uniref:Membrane protein YkvI n=1 Tax=Luteimonas endophytica TaxID=3042023 RepID=A0ABT6J936_9GAMM|nr:hypothetical protein [Luteimonas endophytica]MDH5823323.1 hypothetical protein [Luteimonas endophytica]
MSAGASRFQRWLLPGLAFKGFVIGGGYATGRELAEYFLPAGPRGGLLGLALATLVWSTVCAVTFLFARATRSYDYRAFFGQLVGRGWVVFEASYVVFMVLILAVFGAAAGAIVAAATGWPPLVGTLALMLAIGAVVTFGNRSVERLFGWASVLLYAVYFLFVVFAWQAFGERIGAALSAPQPAAAGPPGDWIRGGLTYACYNIVGAVAILPVARHFTSRRDAAVAGLLAGPIAILPAFAFFACMAAWLPAIADEPLPADYMLRQMQRPLFHLLFQAMIFSALLESGVGAVHAVNERVAGAWRARGAGDLPRGARPAIAAVLLVGSIFVAGRFGLVDLIAHGYRALAWLILFVFVLPLLTVGVWRLWARPRPASKPASEEDRHATP